MGRASSLLPSPPLPPAHQGDVAGLLLAEPVLCGVKDPPSPPPAHQGDVAGLLLAEPVLRGVEAEVLLGPRQGQQRRQVPERVLRAAGGRCGGVAVLLLWGEENGGWQNS